MREEILQKQAEKGKIDFDKNEEDILSEVLSLKEIVRKEEEYLEKLEREISSVKKEIEENQLELKVKLETLLEKRHKSLVFLKSPRREWRSTEER